MREFINIQISDGLKTRLKEIANEINAINEKKKRNAQEEIESNNNLQRLSIEKSNIESELKRVV